MVDVRRLEQLVVLSEELNFRRAAERCRLSQPAFSRSIAQLERQIGAPLVVRTTRSVVMTELGANLVTEARDIISSLDRLLTETKRRALTTGLSLRVGFKSGAAGLLLTPTVKLFEDRFPQSELSLRRLEWAEQIDAVRTGKVDIAFAWWRGSTEGNVDHLLAHLPLVEELRVVGLACDHPLANAAALTLSDLANDPVVVSRSISEESSRWWSALPRPDGAVPPEGPVVESAEEMLEAVARNRGICIVSASVKATYGRPDVRFVPVLDAEPARIALVWRREDERSVLRWFRCVAQEVAAASAASHPFLRAVEAAD
jgi:DNA-binding transcriptional LysR family regulator